MRWLDAVVPWAELAAKRVARGAADAVTRAAVVKFEDLDGRADDGDDDDNNEEYGVLVGTTRDDALAALLRHLLSCFKIDDRGEIDVDDDAFQHIEALIQSMTPFERANPDQMNGSRRRRIAKGAGLEVQDVNALLKQFREMKKMMKTMSKLQGKGRAVDPNQLLTGR